MYDLITEQQTKMDKEQRIFGCGPENLGMVSDSANVVVCKGGQWSSIDTYLAF